MSSTKPSITLIHPKLPHVTVKDVSQEFFFPQEVFFPRPHSLFYIYGALKRNTDYNIQLIDMQLPRFHERSWEDIFQDHPSVVYGITATTDTRFEAIRLAKYLKTRFPHAYVVAGGVHFTHTALDAMQQVPEFDFIVTGEGDDIIVNLVNALVHKNDVSGIEGILYRDPQGRVKYNMAAPLIENIDNIPSCFDFSREDYPESIIDVAGNQWAAVSIITSRGCPYHCAFCSNTEKRYRVKNVKLVVDEIELVLKKFDVQAIKFLDATFTTNAAHLRRFCQELLSRNLNITWSCASRANIPLGLLAIMHQAGCRSITVGVETGSQRILERITKGISAEKAYAYFQKCKELGIRLYCFFILSHPDETRADVYETFKMIQHLDQLGFQYSYQICTIFPGTGLEQIARESGLLPQDFSWNAPYCAEANQLLGENPHVPLFLDKFTIADLRNLMAEYNALWQFNRSRSFYEKMWASGVWGLLRRFVVAVKEGRDLRLGFHLRMLKSMAFQWIRTRNIIKPPGIAVKEKTS